MPPKANPQHRREHKTPFAKALRRQPTDAERKLWWLLRRKRVEGIRFRRQQPIGPYVADFFCAAAKLIVELDGEQHGTDANLEYDEQRTQYLDARGYRVLRLGNHFLLKHPEAALETIWRAVKENLPSP